MMFSWKNKRAILFADVSGSSALYKAVGNKAAKSTIDSMIKVMTHNTRKYEGRVVKTMGDEVMSSFEDCEKACLAAIDIQKDSEVYGDTQSLGVRIGVGYGKTLKDGDDLFGESVNDAAFVAGIAKSAQILLTESVAQQLPADMRQSIQEFDQVAIKGASDHSSIFRLFWKTPTSGFSETQIISVAAIQDHLDQSTLHLKVSNQTINITPADTPFIIGRSQSESSLHVDNELVSRDHCHIIFRRGKFVLVDYSSNGTYIKPLDGQEIYLRREELPLLGEGTISLGSTHEASTANVITFVT